MRTSVPRSAVLAVVASLVMASTVLASGPGRIFWFGGGFDVFLPAGTGVCSFDVDLVFPPAQEYALVFYNPDGSGRIMISGAVKMEATNVSLSKTLSWNISGPGGWSFDAEGNTVTSVGHGPNVVWGSFLPTQDSGLNIYTGYIDYLSGTYSGRVVDVCAALAG